MIKEEFLSDFTKQNIINWIKDLYVFFIKPRKYLELKSNESAVKLFNQYLFYFILYTFSYLILYAATDFNELLKPSLLNLFISIQFILFFQVCCLLISKSKYLKKIVLLVLTWTFIVSPLLTVLNALYLGLQVHIYYTLAIFANTLSTIILFFGFGFFIEKRILQSLKLLLSEVLISSAFYIVIVFFINNFNQSDISFGIVDPIYDEYSNLISKIDYEEKLPIINHIIYDKQEIGKIVAVGSLKNGKNLFSWDSASWNKFKITNKENLVWVQSQFTSLQFQKNKSIANDMMSYFNSIDTFTNNNYQKLLDQHKNVILSNLMHDTTTRRDIQFDDALVSKQLEFKAYNNSLIKSHKLDIAISQSQNIILFFFGRTIDNILNRNKKTESEPFYKIEN